MTSRTYVNQLSGLIAPLLDVPVFLYDGNFPQTLPCIIIGVDSEKVAEGNLNGNYVLESYIMVITNGYDDLGNDIAQGIHDEILDGMNGQSLSCLDGMFYNGSERSDGEESTLIKMNFEAFTHTT